MTFWKTVGSVLLGGIGALALPIALIAVWLPREFDELSIDIVENKRGIDSLVSHSQTSLQEFGGKLAEISSLNNKILASVDASNGDSEAVAMNIGYLAASMTSDKEMVIKVLEKNFPTENLDAWALTGKIDLFKASTVNGNDFLFVDQVDYKKLSMADRNLIGDAEKAEGLKFKVWDTDIFPGFDLNK